MTMDSGDRDLASTSGPYFFLSYAHSDPLAARPHQDPDQLVGQFYDDLTEAVRRHASRRSDFVPGFCDREIPRDGDCEQVAGRALGAAQVLVPLYSPGYLARSRPGRELACFRQRVELAGGASPDRRVVPVLWAPLADAQDPPGLREAMRLSGNEPAYAENGLRALLKIKAYHGFYQDVVDQLATRIVTLAEASPIGRTAIPDINEVRSEFLPQPRLAPFVIQTIARSAGTALPGQGNRGYGADSTQWRPFSEEAPLAEYARQVVARFDFDAEITGIEKEREGRQGRPGIMLIDPWFIADDGGRTALAEAIARRPRWVLPLVILSRPDDERTRELAVQVREMLEGGSATLGTPARPAVHQAGSLEDFVAIIPELAARAGQQYIRYRSDRKRLQTPDEGAGNSTGTGQVVTFYSFKGGTGRTMALANVAWILAANGLRVLIADWDLDSPGLHRFFQPFMEPDVRDRPGIVDFVRQYLWAAERAGIPPQALVNDTDEARATARTKVEKLIGEHIGRLPDYTVPLAWQFQKGGALHFLPAGKQPVDYQPSLSSLDWDNFYDNLHGGLFLEAFREHLKRTYDYVLIDSRTGLSDMADICTIHLPDMVIDCFTLSTQAIEGAAQMAASIRLHAKRNITIWPIPMRIDHSHEKRVAAGLEFAERLLRGIPAVLPNQEYRDYWDQVQVPYVPSYAYEETLAAFGDRPGSPGSLLSSYERITGRITGGTVTALPPREEWLRLRTRLLFSRTAEELSPPPVVLDFSPQDQLWAEWITAVLASAGVSARWVDEQSATPSAEPGDPARAVTIFSESYSRRMLDAPPSALPELFVCVDESRIPSQQAEVPAIFLADQAGDDATDMLIDRLGGQHPMEPEAPNPDLRYPGAALRQVLNVPTRNANFTGRDKNLRELREALRSRSPAAVLPVSLQGLGGIGKTQLAIEYAHRFKADYDVVWWLNCGQPQYVDASLVDLGARLREEFGADIPGEGGTADVAWQVLRYLGDSQTQVRWLLIYDSAEDIDSIRHLLPTGRGHVLITSRDERWREHGAQAIKVDDFVPEESVSHLRSRVPGISEDEAEQVAALLGHIPLAVATAAALLATTGMTITEYLRQLETQPEPSLPPDHPLGDYPTAVTKTWHRSLDELQQQSPAASKLLAIFSMMAPDISLDLINSQAMTEAVREIDPTITERAMLPRLLRQLDLLALIKVDNASRRIQVHRLLQPVVNERLTTAERDEARKHVHQVLVAVRPEGDVDDPRMWPRYRLIWPHLTPSQAMCSTRPQVRDLLIDRVRYLRQRDELERGIRHAAEIESAWLAMLAQGSPPDQDKVLRAQLLRLRFNMADILRQLGRFPEARATDEEVLQGQRELLGEQHPHTLQTRSGLAADLRALGDYKAALELDLQTYRWWSETSGFGEEYPGTLSAAHNLALSYLLNGDSRLALGHDRVTLERRTAVFGNRHPRTLNSEAAVARDLLEAGRYRDAAARMEHVWTEYLDTLGHGDRAALNARRWLGVALRCTGRPDLAAPHIDEARAELARGFGAGAQDTLSAGLSQAINLLALQRPGAAKTQAEELLAAYDERVGPLHPYSLACRVTIAAALYAQEDFVPALDHAYRAADGLHTVLGAEHPYTLSATMMLANLRASDGDLAEAAELENRVATERSRVLGPLHPDTLRARANYLLTLHELGTMEASGERQEVIAELARLLGDDHPDVTTVISGRRLVCVIDPQPF
ncbi:MAG TPA: FxSxx-COOH system tetratricopeptide repeat protein [Trebonia sp.]